MNKQNNKCACCAVVQKGNLKFIVGAKSDNPHLKDDWVLIEGTGRLVCPACYPTEIERGRKIIERYISTFNARAKTQNV